MKSAQRQPSRVVVLSDNPETLEGLRCYFDRTGIESRATRDPREGVKLAEADAFALLVFPDDFRHEEVRDLLHKVRHLSVVVLLVTRAPGRFRKRAGANDATPLVFPKPAFGWELLDTIRSYLGTDGR